MDTHYTARLRHQAMPHLFAADPTHPKSNQGPAHSPKYRETKLLGHFNRAEFKHKPPDGLATQQTPKSADELPAQ